MWGRGTLDIIDKKKDFIEKEINPHKIKLVGLVDLDIKESPSPKNTILSLPALLSRLLTIRRHRLFLKLLVVNTII